MAIKNPFVSKSVPMSRPDNQSAGILDDYPQRKDIQTMTISANQIISPLITSNTGDINFDNENLTTTGYGSFGSDRNAILGDDTTGISGVFNGGDQPWGKVSVQLGYDAIGDVWAGYFADDVNNVKICDRTYALQVTGNNIITGDIKQIGDLYWENDDTGVDFGEMHADGTPYKFDTNGSFTEILSDWHAGLNLHNITFPNVYYLQVAKAGRYLVNYSLSLEPDDGNGLIETAVMVNGTVAGNTNDGCAMNSHFGTADISPNSSTMILDLAANDIVSLAIKVTSGTDTDVTMHRGSLTLMMIGGS